MLERSKKLGRALDVCALYERKAVITGRPDGATASQFGDAVIAALSDPGLDSKWQSRQAN